LIRLDRTGHTELAEWNVDGDGVEHARAAFAAELDHGYFAVATGPDGGAEQVRQLPLDAQLVVLRRPIAGG
jgi:hypothetical protein